MIQKDATYVVMGLLDSDSIAYCIGQTIKQWGGNVIYTVQSERMKRIFLDRSKKLSDAEKADLDIQFCDVTVDEEVKNIFDRIAPVAGVVHSIAYANPKTCLGEEFHTDAYEDLKTGFHISVVSLATVARYAQPHMKEGGALVTLSFAAHQAFPYYNWMGVNKAALEATVRALARRHGRDHIRVNAVSAGPLETKAAGAIPGFTALADTWNRISPLPWDSASGKQAVANATAFLVGPYAQQLSGQVIYVDGGASIMGGELLPFELPERA